MKTSSSKLSAALAMIGLFASIPNLHAQESEARIVAFDVPGAGTGAYQGTGCFGCTFSINTSGTVVGTYVDANNVYHGFLRAPGGTVTTFEAPGANTTLYGTMAQSINDAGLVTGAYYDANGVGHGFLRTAEGVFTSFDAPGAVNGTTPLYINRNGDVVGYALDVNLLFHAFQRLADGKILVFVGPGSCTSGTPAGCYGNEASYIDPFGFAVGNFEDDSVNLVGHGMIRNPDGRITVFNAPQAGSGAGQGTGCPGCNFGVNRWGAIAGTYTDANYVTHGFLRGPEGKFITIDAPGAGTGVYQGTGCPSDCPVDLNDSGVLTGSYYDANYVQHGFARSPSGALVSFDPPGSAGTQPESINNAGTIVGYYQDSTGAYHGFLRVSD
jgi:hypothetical protein